jgi:hypothetical protein
MRGHLPREILAQNLFAIYYRLLQEWLGEYITYEQYVARIRPALELQLSGLRSETAPSLAPARTGAPD